MNTPFISVIIPVKNESKTIEASVKSVLSLDYPSFELVVVNDGSTDSTSVLLQQFVNDSRLKVFENPVSLGPSSSRNSAVSGAAGEYIAFTDGDCIVDKNWLNELVKGFEAPPVGSDLEKIAAVGGIQLSPGDESAFGKISHNYMAAVGFVTDYMKKAYASGDPGIELISHNPSCNVLYRKKLLIDFGGFCTDLWPGEDVDLDHRLLLRGYKLLVNPKAVVYHYRSDSMQGFCRMMRSYGKAQGLLVRKYGLFRPVQYIPLFVAGVVLLLILLLFVHYIWSLAILGSFVILNFAFFSLRRKNLRSGLALGIMNLSALLEWNSGFVRGLFLGKR